MSECQLGWVREAVGEGCCFSVLPVWLPNGSWMAAVLDRMLDYMATPWFHPALLFSCTVPRFFSPASELLRCYPRWQPWASAEGTQQRAL